MNNICRLFVGLLLSFTLLGAGILKAQQAEDGIFLLYGDSPYQTLELFLPKDRHVTTERIPLLIWQNGYRFDDSDTQSIPTRLKAQVLKAGVAVAVVNRRGVYPERYRPVENTFMDGARAVQFLKSRAGSYGLDRLRFILSGSGAGGMVALWVALNKNNFSDRESEDPVLRRSASVAAVVGLNAPVSLDPESWDAIFRFDTEKFSSRFMKKPFLRSFFGVADTFSFSRAQELQVSKYDLSTFEIKRNLPEVFLASHFFNRKAEKWGHFYPHPQGLKSIKRRLRNERQAKVRLMFPRPTEEDLSNHSIKNKTYLRQRVYPRIVRFVKEAVPSTDDEQPQLVISPTPDPQATATATVTPTQTPTATFTATATATATPTSTSTNAPTQTPTPTATATSLPERTAVAVMPIRLPIEVFTGGQRKTVSLEFFASEKPQRIKLSCHRCSYRDASVNPERGAKVSIRINNDEWVPILDETVSVFEPSKTFGGLAGGFHTVSFNFRATPGAVVGKNRIDFRFNQTDGFTNGFRVIDFDVIGPESSSVLVNSVEQDNPADWERNSVQETILQGRELWFKDKILKDSPISDVTLNASCNDCHAHGGRDLQYFNYSSESIVERSRFHGLTRSQGESIAAYIRSLDIPVTGYARPWNPPYQPGKDIDERPAYEWAAGGGLKSVLKHDIQTLDDLFPEGRSRTLVNTIIDSSRTLNVREVRTVLQFPDWNAWLPEKHPKDFYNPEFYYEYIHAPYAQARTRVIEQREQLLQTGEITDLFGDLRTGMLQTIVAKGPQPCLNNYVRNPEGLDELRKEALNNLDEGVSCGEFSSNLHRLHSLRVWELMHEFDLEDKAPLIYKYGEKRGWLGNIRSVFDIASHRSATNNRHHTWQSEALGSYHSNVWYQLQLVLNSGGFRERANFIPQDWFYTPNWLTNNAIAYSADLGSLMIMNELKKYQVRDSRGPDLEGKPLVFGGRGWWMPFMHPWRLYTGKEKYENLGVPWNSLDKYDSQLRGMIADAFLLEFLEVVQSVDVSELPREDYFGQDSSGSAFDSVDTDPQNVSVIPEKELERNFVKRTYQSYSFFKVIPKFYEIGVRRTTMDKLINWCQQVWPNGDWESLRQ